MPVVRTCFYEVFESTPERVLLKVHNEHIRMRLGNLYEIPFNQVLYLLRESTIGFERLFNKLGGFDLTPNMISVN